MPTTVLPDLPAVLIAAFAAACAAQVARQLMLETPPRARRLVAAACAAGLAALATCGLLLEWFQVSAVFLVAVSCVVGWAGGEVLGLLASALEAHLGVRMRPRRTGRRER